MHSSNKKVLYTKGFHKCQRCDVTKPISAFSKAEYRRIAELQKISRHATELHMICSDCQPITVKQIRCISCDTSKDLSKFSAEQRRNRDNARCLNCKYKDTQVQPGVGVNFVNRDGSDNDSDEEYNFCDDEENGGICLASASEKQTAEVASQAIAGWVAQKPHSEKNAMSRASESAAHASAQRSQLSASQSMKQGTEKAKRPGTISNIASAEVKARSKWGKPPRAPQDPLYDEDDDTASIQFPDDTSEGSYSEI